METVLRPVARRDVQTLALIMTQAIATRNGSAYCGINPDFLAFIREALNRPKGWSRVACLDGQIVGFAIGAPMLDVAVSKSEELMFLMTLPEYWGRGIGSELLKAAARICRTRRARYVKLHAQKSNRRALDLYARHGYVVIDSADITNDPLLTLQLKL
ncbi:MAG TPA: GNAT family N-acetyltransferase [Candidatus Saccharimonadales bacterium]